MVLGDAAERGHILRSRSELRRFVLCAPYRGMDVDVDVAYLRAGLLRLRVLDSAGLSRLLGDIHPLPERLGKVDCNTDARVAQHAAGGMAAEHTLDL